MQEVRKLGLHHRHRIPEFPPKRLRNTGAKVEPSYRGPGCRVALQVLESRRTGLEHWLQGLARVNPVPQPLTAFLELSAGSREADTSTCCYGYRADPCLTGEVETGLAGIITQATLAAFYS